MKKIVLFLVIFFSLMKVTYAEPLYCYVEKDSSDSMVLKSNDIVTVYFKSSHEDDIVSAKYQLYFDPYIFEIVKNENEYIFNDSNIKIENVKKHSSLIEFEINNENNIKLSKIYVKLKVKEDAKNDNTTLELIGDNSYIKKLQNTYDENNNISTTVVESKCKNSVLKYVINNESTSSKIVYDSLLSYIDINEEIGFITPSFSPEVFNYKVYLYKPQDNLILDTVCAVEGCYSEEINIGEVKDSKNISFETDNNGTKTKYSLEFEMFGNAEDNDYEYPVLTKLKILK